MERIIVIGYLIFALYLTTQAQSTRQIGVFAGILDSKSYERYSTENPTIFMTGYETAKVLYPQVGAMLDIATGSRLHYGIEVSYLLKGFSIADRKKKYSNVRFHYLSFIPNIGWDAGQGIRFQLGPQINVLLHDNHQQLSAASAVDKQLEFLLNGKINIQTPGKWGFYIGYSYPLTSFTEISIREVGIEDRYYDNYRLNRLLTVGASYRLLGLFPKKEKEG